MFTLKNSSPQVFKYAVKIYLSQVIYSQKNYFIINLSILRYIHTHTRGLVKYMNCETQHYKSNNSFQDTIYTLI